MRNITNISMPPALRKEVDMIVKKGNYASVSEFIRDAIRSWKQEEMYKSVMRSKEDFAKGRFKRLRSLKDLM